MKVLAFLSLFLLCLWSVSFAQDCDGDGNPATPDCNGNGIDDVCDVLSGQSVDCNGNLVPDFCDVSSGSSTDCDSDGLPDECYYPDGDSDGSSDACEPFLRGDANNDGSVDIADVVYLNNYMFSGGPGFSCDDAADANDDETIDISDPTRILIYLYGAGTPLPAPGTNVCGTDTYGPVLFCADSICPG